MKIEEAQEIEAWPYLELSIGNWNPYLRQAPRPWGNQYKDIPSIEYPNIKGKLYIVWHKINWFSGWYMNWILKNKLKIIQRQFYLNS